jgi:hypothetical protein
VGPRGGMPDGVEGGMVEGFFAPLEEGGCEGSTRAGTGGGADTRRAFVPFV